MGLGKLGLVAWYCPLGTASKPSIEHRPVWQWWRCGERERWGRRGGRAPAWPRALMHISASSTIMRDSNRNDCVLVVLENYWPEGKRLPTSLGRARTPYSPAVSTAFLDRELPKAAPSTPGAPGELSTRFDNPSWKLGSWKCDNNATCERLTVHGKRGSCPYYW